MIIPSGTPPVTRQMIEFLYRVMVGDEVRELRKFRDILGITGYAGSRPVELLARCYRSNGRPEYTLYNPDRTETPF